MSHALLRGIGIFGTERSRVAFVFPRLHLLHTFSCPYRTSSARLCPVRTPSTGCHFRSNGPQIYYSPPRCTFATMPPTPNAVDTIFALSSAAGVAAGVAIIRVSGPAAAFCVKQLLQLDRTRPSVQKASFPEPRYASLRKLYHPYTAELLDEAMVLYFPGPRSFTGEDVAEFHVHGSRPVIAGVIEALGAIDRIKARPSIVRPAGRGEFTRRAFENGKLDLTGVEGLADLISAETSEQRNQALRQLGGHIRDQFEAWRAELKRCLAHVEAVIDFGDDVDDDAFEAVVPRVADLCSELEAHLNDGRRGEIVREGARVAIVGEPNAGKSTLLNALARRPAAIVSPHAGTTRDIVEIRLDLNGMAVTLCDTAGLRTHTDDPIEREGMRRAREAASHADLTILLYDASRGNVYDALEAIRPPLLEVDARVCGDHEQLDACILCVANKIDLLGTEENQDTVNGVPVVKTSFIEDTGLSELQSRLEEALRARMCRTFHHRSEDDRHQSRQLPADGPIITRERHRHHLNAAVCGLREFLSGRTGNDRALFLPMDMAVENLRVAAKELGCITGVIHAEEILDVIFNEFCIGK